ncbi:MAG: two-component system sensor histidine kinase NtrB [Candidatus Binatia bacterium]
MKAKGKHKPNSAKHRRTNAGKTLRTQPKNGPQQSHLKTLNQLVQVLSHETRNILGSFATCLELLRRSAQLNKDDRELVDILQSGARRLNEISEQFAAFGPRPPLRVERVELSEIIAGVIDRLRRDERCSSTLDIRVVCDPAIDRIAADRNLLAKVLWNLVLNAAQAMGERGTLAIETTRTDRAVEIRVRDSGPGVPASLRGKIFQPLFTTRTRATGLGLTIARNIVEEHGGEIKLHTGQKKGSLFKVTLPSVVLDSDQSQRGQAGIAMQKSTKESHKHKV